MALVKQYNCIPPFIQLNGQAQKKKENNTNGSSEKAIHQRKTHKEVIFSTL